MFRFLSALVIAPTGLLLALADGPADNVADKVRPIPPIGIAVPAPLRAELTGELDAFRAEIAAFPTDSPLARYLPDVEIYHKAVETALNHNEFYTPKELAAAPKILAEGRQRLSELQAGKAPWAQATGLVVRGYRSDIDGSVQPYGLVVPANHDATQPARLDLWWHGRGEKLSELAFILDRQKNKGEFPQDHAIVLHPYGRYCNANKFAGETDTFEAINHLGQDYKIDPARRVARGFSMGGAACWQFATHFPGYWAAAAPGAGFAETPLFLGNFQKETVKPTWYEQRLWHLTNATDYALNLANLPTVAYSGEIDKQKQAADLMASALKTEGLDLVHIIGAKAGHKYTPEAKTEINRRIDAILAKPTQPRDEIRFTTFTLKYPGCDWVQLEGLNRHYARARVHAAIKDQLLTVTTENVTRLTLSPGAGRANRIKIDGQELPMTDKITLSRSGGQWSVAAPASGLAKRPGLQGPIDDAFTSRFVMVRPTGQARSPASAAWVARELAHAVDQWRKQFRGDLVVVDDTAVTDEMKQKANLILWGDAGSNRLIREAESLPIKWRDDSYQFGGETYSLKSSLPVLVYPSPFAAGRYMVLNSGFTFREYDYLNNARQVAKLPDYAVLDTTTPPTSRGAGQVLRAGFFGERWELLADDGKGTSTSSR